MKRVLLTIFLCWVSVGHGQDVRYVSANTGSDLNLVAASWDSAWATLGMAVTDGQVAGDTVVCVGTFTEEVAPTADGSTNSYIVWIDSLLFTDGINHTKPDTNWSAIIDGNSGQRCVVLVGDDFHEFVGFGFTNADVNMIWQHSTTLNTIIRQCKLYNASDINNWFIDVSGDSMQVISSLFLEDTEANGCINTGGGTDFLQVYNNTFYGLFDFTTVEFTGSGGSGGTKFKNNIVHNPRTVSSGDETIVVGVPASSILEFDFNLYMSSATITTKYEFNGADFDLIATWEDSVNNYDSPNGAANSIGETDPELQAVATTAYILNTSPAAEAGTDLGFGNDIGYFQTEPVSSATPATKPKGKPFIFGENYIEINDSLYVSLN